MQSHVWRQFALELPDEWELLQFSRSAESGRCVFADRYRFRLEMSWRVVKGAPDFARMVADYRGKLEEEKHTDLKELHRQGWHGIRGTQRGLTSSRYGSYFPDGRILLELVFLSSREADTGIENRILDSVHFQPDVDGLRQWCAFGMDIRAAADLPLYHVAADPAHHGLTFRSRDKRREQRFFRQGMVQEWLDTDLETWFPRTVPKEFRVTRTEITRRRGHDVVTLEGVRRLPSLKDLLFGRREAKGAAWICPEDGRLYSLFLFSTRRRSTIEPAVTLCCCGGLEVTL